MMHGQKVHSTPFVNEQAQEAYSPRDQLNLNSSNKKQAANGVHDARKVSSPVNLYRISNGESNDVKLVSRMLQIQQQR